MICKTLCPLHIIDNSTVKLPWVTRLLQTSTFTKHQNFLRPLSSVGVSCKWQPTVSDCDHVKQWLVINLLCCYLLFWFPCSLYELWYWKYRKILLVKTCHCSYVTWHFVFLFTWTVHRSTNRFYSTFCGHASTTNREASIISLDILCIYSLELPTEKPT